MTSPDTQTNWNGITGRIELQFYGKSYLSGIRLDPNLPERSVRITGTLEGTAVTTIAVSASSFNSQTAHSVAEQEFTISPGNFTIDYTLGLDALP